MDEMEAPGPPYVGALLRLCWQRVRTHLHEAIRAHGFTDLQEAHFAVFSYPLPNGVRPANLARQLRMSRQATNYLLGQMEGLGYLERRVGTEGDRRLVYLTERGLQVAHLIYACLRELQGQWASEVGQDRFELFLEVLRLLATEQSRSS
ncbi:MarR family winged helix-turn-helix transcriptional regulator [Neorhizobium petrolearium]|uniref:MarR family winged helix-turn-helix transcriptional regulator n=1 Tax=Neorhizobium petrolearium TaxID=515361 RepID=UPI003F16EB01